MTASRLPAMLHPFARPTATDFLRIVRGEGSLVFDDAGNDYVDSTSGLWFCAVGHGRAEIADAVAEQMSTLAAFHTFERFSNDTVERLADLLIERAPMPDSRVFFTNSGSEAADTAIKTARAARALQGKPEKSVIVAVEGAFHGVTYAGIAVGGIGVNRDRFGETLTDVIHVPRHDIEAVRTVFTEHGEHIAAILLEPSAAASGVYAAPEGYFAELRALCDSHDVWLILDEVVTGFGRLGTMWGAQYHDVRPDLVMFAKAVTSGYIPLGGVFVGPQVRAGLESDPSFMFRHGHTYSGHPAASAGALANIGILEREELISNVPHIAETLRAGFDEIVADGLALEARNVGGICAIELPTHIDPVELRETMIADSRVIARALGTTLIMSPPFVTSDEILDRAVTAVRAGLQTLHTQNGSAR